VGDHLGHAKQGYLDQSILGHHRLSRWLHREICGGDYAAHLSVYYSK
jgi:hypothetical protein